jgi:hypothetical protein
MDWGFIAMYAIAAVYTRSAIAPLLAFVLTLIVGFADMPQPYIHGGFIAIYLALIPLSNTRIAWGMLASAIVNFFAVAYFVSPLYLEGFVLYFATAMTMVNLYILFTIFRSVKNGELVAMDNVVAFRVLNTCHNQTFTTPRKRG